MLRLVSSTRSRLLRAGAFRAAAAAVGPAASGLAVGSAPFQRCYQAPRVFSSSTTDHDAPWKTIAVSNPVAWQEVVKPALLAFFKREKHLMVPIKFVVPHGDDAYPEAAWGYPLGKHAEWLRKQWREEGRKIDQKQREELDEMEFAWDWSQYKWDRFVLPALRRFYELNGHTDVPTGFGIPKGSSEWPEHLWGQHLPNLVRNIRNKGYFANQVKAHQDELKRLKFCYDSTLYDRNWREKVMPALRTFHREFGHCNVSQAFTVPLHLPWPKAAWGMRLGITVRKIRCGEIGANRDKRELEELGFVWNFIESEWSERIMPALEAFRLLKGHCRVPSSFVVPSDENWPTPSWDLRLGNVVDKIRGRGSYSAQVSRDKTRLEELGFVWDFYEHEWSERIMPALTTFHRIKGHCRVPKSFVVPAEATWPREAHSLKLGCVVHYIRYHTSYFDGIARAMDKFEAIEFDVKIPVSKWHERVEPMLDAFEQLHGHRNVPRDFVVPSTFPWEEKDWGVQLGKLERRGSPREI
ncbi:hypothetical protein ON010_g3780 [Phytophthora cinnamomi]|nr:hypothetical protein ON010_g3780 [Phytophthora cinnamomi]